MLFVQHPLLVVVLLVAGARAELSRRHCASARPTSRCASSASWPAAPLAGASSAGEAPRDLGLHLLPPGVFGVGLCAERRRRRRRRCAVLLAAVVVGTIASELVARAAAAAEAGAVRRLLALALAVGAMAAVRELSAQAPAGSAATALALGFALMGASVTGDVLRRFHLPRLTGYLLFGVVVGPYLGNLITESMAASCRWSPASRRR